MKTTMQELLERVKEYRDSETSPLVISRLNSICVDIIGMLAKEEVMIKHSYWMGVIARAHGTDFIKPIEQVDDWYNKTFNTEKK